MIRPWSMQTFPKHTAIYIRKKGMPVGASLITTIHPQGVNVIVTDNKGKVAAMGQTWYELAEFCETWDGKPCGIEV